MFRHGFRYFAILAAVVVLLTGCGRKKYANPIAKDTQQPDKVLFDQAIKEIEKSRYDRGRLLLQTLMNTYDTSEYLAKAKLAIADAWFRVAHCRNQSPTSTQTIAIILTLNPVGSRHS